MNTSKYSDDVIIQTFIDYIQNGLANKVDKETFPYTFGGSCAFEALPAPSIQHAGRVYNITDDFVTTDDFLEGAGISCSAGTEVAIVRIASTIPPTFKYNLFGGGSGGGGGTSNYNALSNKPKINGVTLTGDKSTSDLNIKTSELENDANFATQDWVEEEIQELDQEQLTALMNLL